METLYIHILNYGNTRIDTTMEINSNTYMGTSDIDITMEINIYTTMETSDNDSTMETLVQLCKQQTTKHS